MPFSLNIAVSHSFHAHGKQEAAAQSIAASSDGKLDYCKEPTPSIRALFNIEHAH